MEITIGVSGDKGSSRQQIHSLREKYLTWCVLWILRGVLQLRCVADVPQEGWLEAGMWISRRTGNTEPLLPVEPGSDCLCQYHHLREVLSISISLHVVHLLWEQSKEKPVVFKEWEWEKCPEPWCQGCGAQDPSWLVLCSEVWAQTPLCAGQGCAWRAPVSAQREAKLCQFWALEGTWPADESI